ncbi:MAG: benzoylsuccinyl-CoA thiolase BbsA subunit [Actinomycetota bacterium]|jgi:uncharacterized OB-fold protein|nr:benzoylsuccinyl-CoA thiolase BbsA subunit [Actinomycetota bacterium]
MSLLVPRTTFDPDTATLFGTVCPTCEALHFPPRSLCPDCFEPAVERLALGQTGVVAGHTVFHHRDPTLPNPAVFARVELPEGLAVIAPVVGVEEPGALRVGVEVQLESGSVRDTSDGPVVGYCFRPISS